MVNLCICKLKLLYSLYRSTQWISQISLSLSLYATWPYMCMICMMYELIHTDTLSLSDKNKNECPLSLTFFVGGQTRIYDMMSDDSSYLTLNELLITHYIYIILIPIYIYIVR